MDANNELAPRRVEQAIRADQAARLRATGMTYQRIAEQLGYADASSAQKSIKGWYRKIRSDEDPMMARQMEETRLDELQSRWWVAARTDLKAAHYVLSVIDRRIKLKGLDVNEGKFASAAEAQAMAEMASMIGLQASLIAAMTEAGITPEQMDQVIEILNAKIAPREGDIEGEVTDDGDHD